MRKIITISREFGSGGRELGKRLAEELGIAYYDREIITEISKETGLSEQYIQNISENGIYPQAFHFGKTFANFSSVQSNQTEILVKQQQIIKKIADTGDCVIVGRGAGVILKNHNPMNIFVYSDMQSKIERCKANAKQDENMSDKEIEKKIIKVDKNRKNFHDMLSSLEWGDKNNYHLCINTSGIEIKAIIPALAEYVKKWLEKE